MMVKKWLTTKTIKQDHEKWFDKGKKQNKNQKTWIILSVFRYRLLGSIGVISCHKL